MKAKNFSLKDQDDNIKTLADFKGSWLVLYFYPKDDTKGCTLEATDFTKRVEDFKKLNCEIVGISPDEPKKHVKFITKHDLKLNLLSDSNKEILEQFGVWQTKKMYGKEYMGVVRTTVLINPEGKVEKIWEKVKVTGHVDEVYNVLNEVNK